MTDTTELITNVPPMKPWLYAALFLPGVFLANIFLRAIGGPINLAIVPPTLAVALFAYAAWKNLDDGKGRPRPLVAALLLFVPIVSLVWIYFAIFPIGRAVKTDASKYGLTDEVGDAFSRIWCNLYIGTIALVFLFVIEGMRMPDSSIPYIPLLPIQITTLVVLILWLIIFHVMIFHYSRIITAISAKKNQKQDNA